MPKAHQRRFFFTVTALIMLTTAPDAFGARGGGGSSLGFGLSLTTANQNDLNKLSDGLGGKDIGSGLELYGEYAYRFGGSIFSIAFRPSYFTQSMSDDCTAGSCSFKLTGLTLFPILRLTPLENSFMQFFLQTGIGYGMLSTEVDTGDGTASFKGSAFGAMAGLGANFCFTPTHCLTIEGNLRYLPIERNLASSVSGTPGGFSQIEDGKEVEYGDSDLATTLSGIQGVIAYRLNF